MVSVGGSCARDPVSCHSEEKSQLHVSFSWALKVLGHGPGPCVSLWTLGDGLSPAQTGLVAFGKSGAVM